MKVRSHLNNKQGLYDPANEHDACGVGLIVNVHGGKSHGIVESALKVLENMRHRGAEGADNKTGDGAGILLQIPHSLSYCKVSPYRKKVSTEPDWSSFRKTRNSIRLSSVS